MLFARLLSSLLVLSFWILPLESAAQLRTKPGFFAPADSLNKVRFWGSATTGALIYTSVMIGLNEAWYADFERSRFHLYNDWGEWNHMDKVGHLFTAYMESRWIYQGSRWTGLEHRKSVWLGVAVGTLFQTSLETFDGFSEKWGFSMPDIAFNTLGCALFAAQELTWGEQRITMKVSSAYDGYSSSPIASVDGANQTTLANRADNLYGSSFSEVFLKDYNSQTTWASVNIKSFMKNKNNRMPPWLNVAVGYGAENMYGGYRNEWYEGEVFYQLDETEWPRYKQFYLSLDIDLTRIKTRSPFLKTLFNIFNVLKVPAPALEWNTQGQIRFHPLHW